MRLGYAIFTIAGLTLPRLRCAASLPDWALQISDNYNLLAAGTYWWTVLFPATRDRVARDRDQPRRRRPLTGARAMSARRPPRRWRSRTSTSSTACAGSTARCCAGSRSRSAPGEAYGLVGESGCGKSTTALTVVRYLPRNGRVRSGSIRVAGHATCSRSPRSSCARSRAKRLSMVYQNPADALNPSLKVGFQVAEVFRVAGVPRGEARARSRAALMKVQIADPDSVLERYPHQLSGGMQQRVVIAMALAKDPALLILDEPTTGLDATVEAEVLDLIEQLKADFNTAVLFISHNLGVIRKMCARVGVLYAGRLVEEGPVEAILQDPRHPYTVGLIRCVPRGGVRKDRGRLDSIPGFLPTIGEKLPGCVFAERCGLAEPICTTEEPPMHEAAPGHSSRCHFHERAAELPRATAADLGVSLASTARPSRCCGWTTSRRSSTSTGTRSARWTAYRPRSGPARRSGSSASPAAARPRSRARCSGCTRSRAAIVELDGRALPGLAKRSQEDVRELQIVFQNPDSALNRRHSVRRILMRALRRLGDLRGEAAEKRLLELVSAGAGRRALPERAPRLALGGPQAARRDRPRVRRQPAPGRLRRADLGARRLGAGRDPQPARRAPGAREGRLPLHLPRPRRRALHLRPHRRALPRPADGARARARSSSTVRTTPTPRRCSRRCRRSTAAVASGSSSPARSPAPPSRPPAASSTRAATACSATSAATRSRRCSRSRPVT